MDILTRLKDVPLFASLDPPHLEHIAAISGRRRFPQGSFLFREGESDCTLFIVDSGQVALLQPGQLAPREGLDAVRAGGSLGEEALILGDSYGHSAQAD